MKLYISNLDNSGVKYIIVKSTVYKMFKNVLNSNVYFGFMIYYLSRCCTVSLMYLIGCQFLPCS